MKPEQDNFFQKTSTTFHQCWDEVVELIKTLLNLPPDLLGQFCVKIVVKVKFSDSKFLPSRKLTKQRKTAL